MLQKLSVKELPNPLPLRKMFGPSFILLGLGLGSGEVILWPYLSSHFGLGIIWGALIGLTFQFFINMEIERYALAHGESIFVGFARKFKALPYWFILSTFIPWIWPGIAASSAALIGSVFGIEKTQYLAIGLLIAMGVILTLGPVLYKTVERIQKILIAIGVPSFFVLAIVLARVSDWESLTKGIVGIGPDYFLLPIGIPIASFLGALAYAGAGGNLNLAQSFYVKEKGYGMGKYAGRITSILTGKKEEVSITGSKFEPTDENIKKFNSWWKTVNTEHFIVFWLTGSITILLLSLLAYSTTYTHAGSSAGIGFVINEAGEIGKRLIPVVGIFFLLVASCTLFGTQLTVFDATSRILSENIILASNEKLGIHHISRLYYTVLWAQIVSGIAILLFGFTEPLQLVITAAVLNAFAMFVHSGFTLWLNMTSLDKKIRPSIFRITAMICAFLFYGGFSIYVLWDRFL